MARVLVSGASGFVGFHLVKALRDRGDEVTCLARRTSKIDQLRSLNVAVSYGELADRASLAAAVAGQEIVYHAAGCTAALHSREFFAVNEDGARAMAHACAAQATPPVLVVVSSLAAAGPSPNDRPRTEDDPPVQVSAYGRSKRAGELAVQTLADRVPVTVVRPAIVLGPRDTKGVEIFRAIHRFRMHTVPGLGPRRFSIIHAADLAEALILAACRGKRLKPLRPEAEPPDSTGFYFASCAEHPTYADLGRMVRAELGRSRAWILPVPMPIVWAVGSCSEVIGRLRGKPLALNLDKVREAAAGSWTCSPQRAADELGFRVTTPLAERLRETAQWYRDEGWL